MKKHFTLFSLILLSLLGITSCEKFELEENTDTFFHVDIEGTQLPVWVKGNTASKKMVIYINGGPGLTSIDVARADMFGWSEQLEKEVAMIYYDQRGCGNAQGNLDPKTLTLAQYVRDLDAIISVLKAKYNEPEIYLMGHSFGGFIGANYLLTDGLQNKIAGWISVDGAYNFDYDLSWQYRRTFLKNIAEEELAKDQDNTHWQEALAWVQANPVIENRDQKNELRSYIGWPGEFIIPEELATLSVRQYLGIGFASSYNPFPSYASNNLELVNDALNEDAEGVNLIQAVKDISIPCLFITGKYDDLIVPEETQDVFDNLGASDKTLSIFPASSHEPYISAPEKFQQEILSFVNQ